MKKCVKWKHFITFPAQRGENNVRDIQTCCWVAVEGCSCCRTIRVIDWSLLNMLQRWGGHKIWFSTSVCQKSRPGERVRDKVTREAKPHENQRELFRIGHAELVHLRADKYTGCSAQGSKPTMEGSKADASVKQNRSHSGQMKGTLAVCIFVVARHLGSNLFCFAYIC